MGIEQRPTNDELWQMHMQGFTPEQIGEKYKRHPMGIKVRIANMIFDHEVEAYRANKHLPKKDNTEDELLNIIPMHDLTIGDVEVKGRALYYKGTDDRISW